MAYNAPHSPLQAKKDDLLLYGYDERKPSFKQDGGGENSPDDTSGRGNTRRQTYAAMVTCMDRGIGRILHTLKELNIDDNTLVLFHSDNGAAPGEGGSSGELRGAKFQEWEGGVRAPAIIKWPKGFRGGRTVEAVMGYIDVAPTLRAIAGIKTTANKPYDGVSMLPVLKNDKSNIERTFYLGYGSIIYNRWKLVKAGGGNNLMKHDQDMLFNITTDPSEKTDVKEKYPDVYQQLHQMVKTYDTIKPVMEVPPYGQGRKGYKAPKDWKITQ